MRFGLIFFGSREVPASRERYRLLLAASRYADEQGWEAVWVPERHFTLEGCLFPNPAVVQAALARETRRIRLRAGSVVLPLHHPVRIAEEWAVVDNLSGGRVELSFASGWHPDDFVFFPERYARRREETLAGIERVRRLWRGETITLPGVDGAEVTVRIYPTPIQPELPLWLTAAGSPETYAAAGRLGAGVLTHLFNQEIEELESRIALYRRELAAAGHDPERGRVAVMVHAAIDADGAAARRRGEAALAGYLSTATHLLDAIARSRGRDPTAGELSPEAALDYGAFWAGRLIATERVLFGSPEDTVGLLERLAACGVDELALQVDFGLPADDVMEGLPHLERLRQLAGHLEARRRAAAAPSLPREVCPPPEDSLGAARERCRVAVPVGELLARFREAGVELGEAFRGLERVWTGDGEAVGEVVSRWAGEVDAEVAPAFWDACLQVAVAALPASEPSALLPVGLGRFAVHRPPCLPAFSHARLREAAVGERAADVTIWSAEGERIAEISELRLREVPARSRRQGSFYRIEWTAVGASAPPSAGVEGGWIVVADRGGTGDALAAHLRAGGAEVLTLRTGEVEQPVDRPSPARAGPAGARDAGLTKAQWTGRLAKGRWCGIVHLLSLDAPDNDGLEVGQLMDTQAAICGSALALAQALAAASEPPPALWLVTRGSQAILPGETPAVAQAPLWGFGPTLAQEVPDLRVGLVDLDPGLPAPAQAERLAAELRGQAVEDRLALRGERRLAARLASWRPVGRTPSLALAVDGCYLLAGGTGELGLAVARLLAHGGARRLALLARTPVPPRELWAGLSPDDPWASRVHVLRELEEMGVELALPAVDVAEPAALTACLRELAERGFAPVRGVVQLAGVAEPAPLAACDLRSLLAVLRPKVAGTWALHRALAAEPLEFFVGFSSWAALLGPIGQGLGGYGAANAFLDAVAALRTAQGRPGLAIAWGDWEVGMRVRWLAERRPLADDWSFAREAGLAAFAEALARRAPGSARDEDQASDRLAYLAVDWQTWAERFPGSAASPLLAGLVPTGRDAAALAARRGRPLVEPGGPAVRSLAEMGDLLATEVARALRVAPESVERDRSLPGLGIDSMVAFELKTRLDRKLGAPVSVSALLGERSVATLAAHLFQRLPVAMPTGPAAGERRAEAGSRAEGDPPAGGPTTEQEITEIVRRMSDAEVDRRLELLLDERAGRDVDQRRPATRVERHKAP